MTLDLEKMAISYASKILNGCADYYANPQDYENFRLSAQQRINQAEQKARELLLEFALSVQKASEEESSTEVRCYFCGRPESDEVHELHNFTPSFP